MRPGGGVPVVLGMLAAFLIGSGMFVMWATPKLWHWLRPILAAWLA